MCETLTRFNNRIGHQVALTDSNTDKKKISNYTQQVCKKSATYTKAGNQQQYTKSKVFSATETVH